VEGVLGALPVELLMRVLCLLPREDAVNLRVASRAVATVQLPQEFWKSE